MVYLFSVSRKEDVSEFFDIKEEIGRYIKVFICFVLLLFNFIYPS